MTENTKTQENIQDNRSDNRDVFSSKVFDLTRRLAEFNRKQHEKCEKCELQATGN
jgi:hypothetical protein